MEPKTVKIQDPNADTIHWETCHKNPCIEHECPRYDRCCGEVVNA